MKITESAEFKAGIIKRIAEREFSERTGVHCSDLCYCLNKQALRRLNPLPIREHEILLFSLGWSTQRWLTGQDKDIPEITVDSIKVTCDSLVSLESRVDLNTPWECKASFQSSERPVEENVAWFHQIMAQCYVTRSLVAYLTRLELMGNWKSVFGKKEEKKLPKNEKPTLHAYRLEFTEQELENNWEWLRSRGTLFLQILSSSKLLPPKLALPEGQEWECSYCPEEYKSLCEGG